MPKRTDPAVRAERVRAIRELLAKGLTPHLAAVELGLNSGSVFHLVKAEGMKWKRAWRPTTEAARRAHSARYAETQRTDWQVADPSGFDQELIERAASLLKCDTRHAAWVLSCPKDFNPSRRSAIGHRGGSAIG